MVEFLVTTTGMPERIALKVLQKAPIVVQQNIPFTVMTEHLETIAALGGTASGHLLAFQTFSLVVEKVGDPTATVQLLQVLGGLSQAEALAAIGPTRGHGGDDDQPASALAPAEIKRNGGESRVVLR